MQITEHEKLICFLNGFLTYALGHSQEQTRQWVESWMRHHKHVFDECSAIEKKVLNSYKTGVLGDCIWGCKSVEEKAKPETDWLSWPRYWAMTDKLEGKKKVFRATGTFDIGSWWNDRTTRAEPVKAPALQRSFSPLLSL